ncbi:MAG: hypothetical protein EF813_00955 [Methanosarcinales archaeon]|nr:MAG: hypothetical protein EF813_00955 [Methanosarcinales archaeon]
MGKDNILRIDDLLADEDETTTEESDEALFDLVIPPGLPVTLIQEMIIEFDLVSHTKDVVTEVEEGESFEMKLIVLRGDKETVERANKYLWEVIDDRTAYFED